MPVDCGLMCNLICSVYTVYGTIYIVHFSYKNNVYTI